VWVLQSRQEFAPPKTPDADTSATPNSAAPSATSAAPATVAAAPAASNPNQVGNKKQ
jgi:hypothetical protein